MSRDANLNEEGKATGTEHVAVPAEALLTSSKGDRFEERASESHIHADSSPTEVHAITADAVAPAAEPAQSDFPLADGVVAEGEYGLVDPTAAPADDSSNDESWVDEENA